MDAPHIPPRDAAAAGSTAPSLLRHLSAHRRRKLTLCADTAGPDPDADAALLGAYTLNAAGPDAPDDLTRLPLLTEDGILRCLQSRFAKDIIYSYIGTILVAVNPFRAMPIYNPRFVETYRNCVPSRLPPHIFAVADGAYHALMRTHESQCVIVSGESGSGKTESTKLIIRQIAAVSGREDVSSGVERHLLLASPVLEAFGNAKTVRNDNSSRFGKFVTMQFSASGAIECARIDKYLLEQSRIVRQGKDERNFHVFYYLLAGASRAERDEMTLRKPEHFAYLTDRGGAIIPGVCDSEEFQQLKEAMSMLDFSAGTLRCVFFALAAILHLGNVDVQPPPKDNEAVAIRDRDALKHVCTLLGVTSEALVRALTVRTHQAGLEAITTHCTVEQALDSRDALAKALYLRLFDFILWHINRRVGSHRRAGLKGAQLGVLDIFGFENFAVNSFEQFCINYANEQLQHQFNMHVFRMEQQLYAAENIPWTLVAYSDILPCIELISKRPTGLLSLLDEESSFPKATDATLLEKFHARHGEHSYYVKPPKRDTYFGIRHYAGVIHYEIAGFLQKNRDLMRADILQLLRRSSRPFVRQISCGGIPIGVRPWTLFRNTWRACWTLAHPRASEPVPFASAPTSAEPGPQRSPAATDDAARADTASVPAPTDGASSPAASNDSQASLGGRMPSLPSASGAGSVADASGSVASSQLTSPKAVVRRAAGRSPTVSSQFEQSLVQLLHTLERANPYFVRCIKSNRQNAPMLFEESFVRQQLCYCGLLETARMRRAGYAVRFDLRRFLAQYRPLMQDAASTAPVPSVQPAQPDGEAVRIAAFLRSAAETYMTTDGDAAPTDRGEAVFQVGQRLVFLQTAFHAYLEDLLAERLHMAAVTIQRWVRALLEHRRFQRMRGAVRTIQRVVRARRSRATGHRFRREWRAATTIQRWFRHASPRHGAVAGSQRGPTTRAAGAADAAGDGGLVDARGRRVGELARSSLSESTEDSDGRADTSDDDVLASPPSADAPGPRQLEIYHVRAAELASRLDEAVVDDAALASGTRRAAPCRAARQPQRTLTVARRRSVGAGVAAGHDGTAQDGAQAGDEAGKDTGHLRRVQEGPGRLATDAVLPVYVRGFQSLRRPPATREARSCARPCCRGCAQFARSSATSIAPRPAAVSAPMRARGASRRRGRVPTGRSSRRRGARYGRTTLCATATSCSCLSSRRLPSCKRSWTTSRAAWSS